DDIVIATGVSPRIPDIPGIEHGKCVSYVDLLAGRQRAGERVAIIGAGGIGFDIAEYLSAPAAGMATPDSHFRAEWGIDAKILRPGGRPEPPAPPPRRHIVMLQRKSGRMGRRLGLSTGWALRLTLAKRNVAQLSGVTYGHIDDAGLHIEVEGRPQLIAAATIVICAAQDPARGLHQALKPAGRSAHLIGGAERAAELDAMRAIDQGTRLAYGLGAQDGPQ